MNKTFFVAVVLLTGLTRQALTQTCGEGGLTCGEDQTCCEHVVGTFCEDQSCAYTYVQGECVGKGKPCNTFLCGPRVCETTWLRSKNVCCVYHDLNAMPSYSCRASELNCQGNAQRLSIRPHTQSGT